MDVDGSDFGNVWFEAQGEIYAAGGNKVLHAGNTYVSSNKGYINNTEITYTNTSNLSKFLLHIDNCRSENIDYDLNSISSPRGMQLSLVSSSQSLGTAPPYRTSKDGPLLTLMWDGTPWGDQLHFGMRYNDDAHWRAYENGTWQAWKTFLDSANYTSYTVTKSGAGASGTWGINISGNAASATKWQNARTLTIGNTGKSVDGTSNVSWSLSEIGAASSGHTHDDRYVNVTGDSMSGALSIQTQTKTKSSPLYQQLVINGPNYNESDTLTLQSYPGIGFHMPGRTWANLIWNGNFSAVNAAFDGYYGFYGSGFKKDGSSNSYVLLGGGGHKLESSLSVSYSASSGNADTLDNYHANGLLTSASLGTSGNSTTLSVSVGGTTKTGSVTVPYATNSTYSNSAGSTNVITRIWQRGNDCKATTDFPYDNQTRFYMYDSTTTNKPTTAAGFMMVNGWDWGPGGSILAQNFDDNDYGRLYTACRPCGGSWSDWRKVAFTTDLPTKASWNYDDVYSKLNHTHSYLPLSGGSMSGHITVSSNYTYDLGSNTSEFKDAYIRQISARHIDASAVYNGDRNLYIGYGIDDRRTTEATFFYYSKKSSDNTVSRTLFAEINSYGLKANTRFGVNGQNTSYNLYVNGSANITSALYENGNRVITSANIGSQSVSNADTVDGHHETGFQRATTSTKRDFINGTLITTDIDYNVKDGHPFYMEIKGNTYGRYNSCFTQVQGYIYNNTIIHYGVSHLGVYHINGIIAINVDGNLCFWFPRQSYWEGYSIVVYSAFDYRVNRITSITDSSEPSGTKRVDLASNTHYTITTLNISSSVPNLSNSEIDAIIV